MIVLAYGVLSMIIMFSPIESSKPKSLHSGGIERLRKKAVEVLFSTTLNQFRQYFEDWKQRLNRCRKFGKGGIF